MSTLTDKVQALLTYANGISGKADTTLGDAVKSLGDGFGGGGLQCVERDLVFTENKSIQNYVLDLGLPEGKEMTYMTLYSSEADYMPQNGILIGFSYVAIKSQNGLSQDVIFMKATSSSSTTKSPFQIIITENANSLKITSGYSRVFYANYVYKLKVYYI